MMRILVLLLIFISTVTQAESKVGTIAPYFELPNILTKDRVSLSDFHGKYVVLEWINPDCPNVKRLYRRKIMQHLERAYRLKGVIWLAINSTHYMTNEDNLSWHDIHRVSYRILSDKTGKVGHAYGAKTTPYMFIINPEGVIVYQGALDDNPEQEDKKVVNYVKLALDALLSGRNVTIKETEPYGCQVKYPIN
jgi:peroxiredoxin